MVVFEESFIMAINTIGVMTGNSLDAVDVVLTSFENDKIKDLASHTLPYPDSLRQDLLKLRELIKDYSSEMEKVASQEFFIMVVDQYSRLVAKAVNQLLEKSVLPKDEIAAIGFHGQTCDHFPPSVAGDKQAYTLQIGNPQLLADLTEIPVIYDFRSDDIINGGEGAPLAPLHNLHISQALKSPSIAFCNAGNTGNIAIIADNVMGWDIGPFNHFPDSLMRKYQNLACDKDGEFGKQGKISQELLGEFFNSAAVNEKGDNFYLQLPPKSSDPHWYPHFYNDNYSFTDNLRTAEYLSAYSFVYNLKYAQTMPHLFLLFGGGWKNPLVKQDFIDLLNGQGLLLSEHQQIFADIWQQLDKNVVVDWADNYGFSGEYMEARIFADMAYCKIINQPFSLPSTTNCRTPTVGGVYVLPAIEKKYLLSELLKKYNNSSQPEKKPLLWSRASKAWQLLAAI